VYRAQPEALAPLVQVLARHAQLEASVLQLAHRLAPFVRPGHPTPTPGRSLQRTVLSVNGGPIVIHLVNQFAHFVQPVFSVLNWEALLRRLATLADLEPIVISHPAHTATGAK
jgi:hypothetical protein